MRLFIGVPLASATTAELNCITQRLKSAADDLRWSDPAGWHVTLQFLGNTTEERCHCVCLQLHGIKQNAFRMDLESPGFFERSRVFFTGVRLSPELIRLQQNVTTATGRCGFPADERPYRPHITLARSKPGGRGISNLKARIGGVPSLSPFVAKEFLLYESILSPAGARYEVRERFPLRND